MLNYIIGILVGIIPALILVGFIYWKDKYQHEPWRWIVKAFLYGVLACVPAIWIEAFVYPESLSHSPLVEAFYNGFIVASLTEEALKYLFFWLLIRHNPYFDERMDGVVYAACVSMGFAGIENIGYLLNCGNDITIAVSRALISVPAHFFFAVFMGYYYSLAVFVHTHRSKFYLSLALIIPVVLHGIFDCALMSTVISPIVTIIAMAVFTVIICFLWSYGQKKIDHILELDRSQFESVASK